MDKKEITKMVSDAVDAGTWYGAGLTALAIGGISLLLGGGFLALFTRDAKRFNSNYPDWDAGCKELDKDDR